MVRFTPWIVAFVSVALLSFGMYRLGINTERLAEAERKKASVAAQIKRNETEAKLLAEREENARKAFKVMPQCKLDRALLRTIIGMCDRTKCI